ncbi:hypothetical protein Tco_1061122 [Tanacetum coccineum]
MFQQHHDESLSEAWTRFKDLLHKVPHHGIDIWLQIQIFYDHVSFPLNQEIDHATGGKLCDKITKESREIIENLALHDHESLNDPRDFAKPVKASTLPQDVPKTSDRQLFELEDQISKEGDEVVDKNIVEPIELVEKEEAVDDVVDNKSNRSVNEDSTR